MRLGNGLGFDGLENGQLGRNWNVQIWETRKYNYCQLLIGKPGRLYIRVVGCLFVVTLLSVGRSVRRFEDWQMGGSWGIFGVLGVY